MTVAAVLTAEGVLDRTTVTSFQVETLAALLRHAAPAGTIWILSNYVMTDVGIAGAIRTAQLHGIPALSVHRTMLTADVVKTVRDAGLGIGGFGTIIGSLAGAAVITLIRALLQLNIVTASGATLSLPQHWVNSFIGGILILAVLIDIWVRQGGLLDRFLRRRRSSETRKAANA